MEKKQCSTCRFWEGLSKNVGIDDGVCQSSKPEEYKGDTPDPALSIFSCVGPDHHCGEWEAKK